MPIEKGNIKHVRTWSQAISSNFSCLFQSKIAKIAKDKCTHRSTLSTLSMHQYLLIESHRRSVITPLNEDNDEDHHIGLQYL